jgi:hypothetical protein
VRRSARRPVVGFGYWVNRPPILLLANIPEGRINCNGGDNRSLDECIAWGVKALEIRTQLFWVETCVGLRCV